jgi:hypothetical protein
MFPVAAQCPCLLLKIIVRKKRNGYEKAYGLAVIDKPHVFSGKANEPKICIMGKKE